MSASNEAHVVDETFSPSEMLGDNSDEIDSEVSQAWDRHQSIRVWNIVEHVTSPQSSEADDVRLPDTYTCQELESDQEAAVETKARDEEYCELRLKEIMESSNEV